tara:strand:+ start:349 stop:1413 length:1065 start_codon:yes stop_codon:yes gene_type:complete
VQKILITTGGTGGHTVPAQIINEYLNDDYEVYYSTDKRGYKFLSSGNKRTVIINTPRFNFSLNLPYRIIKLFYLIVKSFFYLKNENIKKVISIGGYMSLPVIISAKILRLPIFLIEPNLVLGKGNKFFLNFAKKIFCYSNEILNFPKKYIYKIELINPLVSKAFYNLKKKDDINNKFCFLIFGGSQGAKIFDEIIREIMLEISRNFSIKVIQQTSKNNIDNLKNFYDSNNIESIIFDFKKNFFDLINISDLCITRAGATSLAEISFLNKPFIAIPLPTSADSHQMKNAEYYEKKGCCWIIDQKILNKDKLSNFIKNLLKNKNDLMNKKMNLKKLNNKNSREFIYQKLKRVINEN